MTVRLSSAYVLNTKVYVRNTIYDKSQYCPGSVYIGFILTTTCISMLLIDYYYSDAMEEW